MTFSNPILLWSLLGLSVPVAIHLLSRKEGQVIRLGSIRHVHETSTQQFKGLKLNELLLLALRCVMILVFSLLLSGLQCAGISKEKWVVIEPGLENDGFVKSILDSLEKDGFEQRLLSEGLRSATRDNASDLNYWALAERLKEKNLSSVVVLSSNRLENFRGIRPSLPPQIKWIAIPANKIDFPVEAVKFDSDSLYVRTGHSSPEQTSFTTEKIKSPAASVQIAFPDSVRIAIAADAEHAYDRRILGAAIQTIQRAFPVNMKVHELKPSAATAENYGWLFWLSDSNPPEKNTTSTIWLKPTRSNNLLERVGPRTWHMTKRLNEEIALEKNLTIELALLIVPSKKQQEIAEANDRRTMPDSMAWSSATQLTPAGLVPSVPNRFLIVCLVLLLLTERIIAYRRNQ